MGNEWRRWLCESSYIQNPELEKKEKKVNNQNEDPPSQRFDRRKRDAQRL